MSGFHILLGKVLSFPILPATEQLLSEDSFHKQSIITVVIKYEENIIQLLVLIKLCTKPRLWHDLMLLCLNGSKSMLEYIMESFSRIMEGFKKDILPNAHDVEL